jgi:preprotein translocase subunit Sss1
VSANIGFALIIVGGIVGFIVDLLSIDDRKMPGRRF